MILTTLIVSFYMILVYVVGGGGMEWKLVLVALSLIGMIYQVYRGRSKGKGFADSLVDHDIDEIKEIVSETISSAVGIISPKNDSEE